MTITIRPSTPGDAQWIMDAFDSTIPWLVSKGLAAQWGTELFSVTRGQKMIEKLANLVKGFIAEVDGQNAGCLAFVEDRPEYLPKDETEKGESELYVYILLVHRDFAGKKVGDALLDKAKEVGSQQGKIWLRLDCFRGEGTQRGLVQYYERQGFRVRRNFLVPRTNQEKADWPGSLMELKL